MLKSAGACRALAVLYVLCKLGHRGFGYWVSGQAGNQLGFERSSGRTRCDQTGKYIG